MPFEFRVYAVQLFCSHVAMELLLRLKSAFYSCDDVSVGIRTAVEDR